MRNLATTLALAALVLMTTPTAAIGGGGPSEPPTSCACAEAFASALAEANAADDAEDREAARLARELAEQDLAAQQGMDRSTAAMAELTRRQWILAIWSLVGLGLTALFTGLSLLQAREELKEARDFQQKALRSYLSVERYRAKLIVGADSASVRFDIANRGQTSAHEVTVSTSAWVSSDEGRKATWRTEQPMSVIDHFGLVQPQQVIRTGTLVDLTASEVQALTHLDKCLVVQVSVEYVDVFGTKILRQASNTFFGSNANGRMKPAGLPEGGNAETIVSRTGGRRRWSFADFAELWTSDRKPRQRSDSG